jgi:hypothetical protein
MENVRFSVWVKAKENQRFLLCAAGIVLMALVAEHIHGMGALRYPTWTAFAENVPCDKVERVNRDVQVTGPLEVDRKNYGWHHPIADQNLVKVIDERCHLSSPGS